MVDKSAYIHSAAIVEKDVTVGADTRIWAFTHILPDVTIGKLCNICDFCFIESGVVLGDEVTVKSGIYIWDGVVLKDKVFLGPNVVFTNDLRPRSKAAYTELETLVDKGATVGANSVIICGNKIGSYAMVGAGSVVTKDVPAYGLVYGNPARLRGFVCQCAKTLTFKDGAASCSCGLSYTKSGNSIKFKL